MQILTENNREEKKTSSHTAVKIKILSSKRNEDITEELERNIHTQFQLQKKCEEVLKMIKANDNKEF